MREALPWHEPEFRALAENAPDIIARFDRQLRYLYVNPAVEEATGLPPDAFIGRTHRDLNVPEEIAALWESLLLRVFETGEAEEIEFSYPGPEGDSFFQARLVPEHSLHRRVVSVLGIIRDITERKQAEERIRFQAHLLDMVGQAVIATDTQGKVLYWNRAAEALYGWTAEEVLERNVLELTPAEVSREQAAQVIELLTAGESWSGELLVRRRDGSTFPAHVTDTPIHDANGNLVGIVGISSDVTSRRQLEEQLRHAQKMEAVGRLAGGIAHDFNNILTAIHGSATFLLSDLDAQHPSRVDAEGIQRAAMRAASLIRQLLAFSRRQLLQPQVLDLNVQLSEMAKMLARVIGEDIKLVKVFRPGPALVRVDPVQLEQVVLNLCINARDAMPEGGTLTLEVAHQRFASVQVRGYGWSIPPGSYVRLSVSDTGDGMDEEVLSHLFEPFFTTKEQGKGTGLGLPTVYGIIKQSGGYIDVHSTPGAGATFDIFLPSVRGEREAPSAHEAAAAELSGTETILLVEDEDLVRWNSRRVLQRSGYTVIEARDGEDALQIFEADPAAIDLLLTDLVMPRLSGRELAERVRSRRPDLRVLCMSGYMDERTALLGPGGAELALLEKPFHPAALLRKVRELLDDGNASERRRLLNGHRREHTR